MTTSRMRTDRGWFFAVELTYLAALAVLFILYEVWPVFRNALPSHFGDLPSTVPWFGAVGGTLISLTGVFKHSVDWDEHYGLWHYARPLVGAFLGSIGALVFLVIVNTATVHHATPNAAVYEVVAFLVGYREVTFRALIQRATDVLFSSSDQKSTPDSERRPPDSPEP